MGLSTSSRDRHPARPGAVLGAVLGAALAALLAGCATAQTPEPKPEQTLREHMAQCTSTHGYDPANSASFGPNEIAPGERDWRACVYEAVEQHMVPRSRTPESYRALIAADREMTRDIAAGRLTRAERRARLEQMFGALRQTEEARRQEQTERNMEFMEREMERMREMQRHEQLLRQSLAPRVQIRR